MLSSCQAGPGLDCFGLPPRRNCCDTVEVEQAATVESVRAAPANVVKLMPFVPASGFDVASKDSYDLDDAVPRHTGSSEATTADTILSPLGRYSGLGKDCPADFGGSWICVQVVGDMEAFLSDMGLTAELRQAARDARYGVGRQVQNVAQVGDDFVIQNILKVPVTMRFRVGAGAQQSVDQEGKPILIDPWWDGDSLKVTSKRGSGELIAHSRRYFEGESMVLELTSPPSPNGTVVSRFFDRR